MPQNFYELAWIFCIYAFIGWCVEVAYAALKNGKFVNRGFLNGPYCPIYGCGVVIVVTILDSLRGSIFLLFVGSFLLTSALEFVTGYILEKVFHNKWWDYSDKPFNIKGYVCLEFSIYWGLGCTFILDKIHPMIYRFITWLPSIVGIVMVSITGMIFVTDCCITVSTILKFNKRLKIMDQMAASIHKLSDEIGENIYENVTGVMEKSEEFQKNHPELMEKLAETKENIKELPETTKVKLAETKENIKELPETTKAKLAETKENIKELPETTKAKLAETLEEKKQDYEKLLEEKRREYAEMKEKYDKLFSEKNFGFKRLIKAFPDMTSRDNNDTLQKYKNYFNIKKIGSSKENKKED